MGVWLFEVFTGEKKMVRVTVGDLMEQLGVEYAVAGALVKLMVLAGQGKEVGKRPTTTGKGKPATIYELNETFTLSLGSAVAVAA